MNKSSFERLVQIMDNLRKSCPWDIEQTHDSLKKYCLEEAYEVVEAIGLKDDVLLCEELGDLLLQVVFHARIASERKAFDIDRVIENICEKLIRRHPHVFGQSKNIQTGLDVKNQWEDIKTQEGKIKKTLDVPKSFPALKYAHEIGLNASKVHFDWLRAKDVFEKVKEELAELESVMLHDQVKAKEELGDLLFSISQLARHLRIDPEIALRDACQKFQKRFMKMEAYLKEQSLDLNHLSESQKEQIWQDIKK